MLLLPRRIKLEVRVFVAEVAFLKVKKIKWAQLFWPCMSHLGIQLKTM